MTTGNIADTIDQTLQNEAETKTNSEHSDFRPGQNRATAS